MATKLKAGKEEAPPVTLRDRFAMAALPQLINDYHRQMEEECKAQSDEEWYEIDAAWSIPDRWETVADAAYAVADAMLKARAQ